MEFLFSVFFLLFYYLRPQDWISALTGVELIKPILAIWILVLLMGRSRESPLKGLLKTPHDWVIAAYFAYVVFTAPDFMEAFKGFLPLVLYYVLTVQSLSTWERVSSYLRWWIVALCVIAVFGVLIRLGLDITGGKENVARFVDRLCLGTWLHNNPNALAHSVIVVLPAAFLLFFWRGTIGGRWLWFPLCAGLSIWCVYETVSKGAFLVGGILVASVFVIGRPKVVQILTVVVALTVGGSVLSMLPRMSQMSDLRADEGVQGRLMAWEIARGVSRTNDTGVGWKQFLARIDWKEESGMVYGIPKATHSSYVQVGADLGKYGMVLYLAGFWCAFHTLLRLRSDVDQEERCRRVLFVLLLGTVASGWMINRQYHAEYFLLIALAGAMHRLRKGEELGLESVPDDSTPNNELGETARTEVPVPAVVVDESIESKPLWNRFGLVDALVCASLAWAAFWAWDYVLNNL